MPNALLIAYVGFLIAAGAPARSPSLPRALAVLDGLTTRQIIAILLGLLVISVATHPLQTPLIQFVEGYWWGLPFGPTVANHFTERFRSELRWVNKVLGNDAKDADANDAEGAEGAEVNDAKDTEADDSQDSKDNEAEESEVVPEWDWATRQAAAEAKQRQLWLPDDEDELLPTVLGNTLRAGEIRAGARYGLKTSAALPRLVLLLSPPSLAELRDRRNQLDAAVRLCIAAGLATAIGVGLLLWHGAWLFLALVTYLLCWACYRAAVAAARDFSVSLAAAIDLHHLQLFDALQLERPSDMAAESYLNATLSRLFSGFLDEDEMCELRYSDPKADNQLQNQILGRAAARLRKVAIMSQYATQSHRTRRR